MLLPTQICTMQQQARLLYGYQNQRRVSDSEPFQKDFSRECNTEADKTSDYDSIAAQHALDQIDYNAMYYNIGTCMEFCRVMIVLGLIGFSIILPLTGMR